MKKLLLVLMCAIFTSATLQAQVKITDKKVQDVIKKVDPETVEVMEIKTMKKFKALGLSSDMKDKMDYNVIRVKYRTEKLIKTIVIDVNLVPIEHSQVVYANRDR